MDDEILYESTGHWIVNCSAYWEHCPDNQEQIPHLPIPAVPEALSQAEEVPHLEELSHNEVRDDVNDRALMFKHYWLFAQIILSLWGPRICVMSPVMLVDSPVS